MVFAVGDAKKEFSRLVRESSEQMRVFTVQNAQRHGAKAAVIISEETMDLILQRFTFIPQWEEDREQGLWSVYVPEIDVWGQGETREQAAEDLVSAAIDYADVYMDDVRFHIKVGRQDHLPYILRIYRTGGDRQAVREALSV